MDSSFQSPRIYGVAPGKPLSGPPSSCLPHGDLSSEQRFLSVFARVQGFPGLLWRKGAASLGQLSPELKEY